MACRTGVDPQEPTAASSIHSRTVGDSRPWSTIAEPMPLLLVSLGGKMRTWAILPMVVVDTRTRPRTGSTGAEGGDESRRTSKRPAAQAAHPSSPQGRTGTSAVERLVQRLPDSDASSHPSSSRQGLLKVEAGMRRRSEGSAASLAGGRLQTMRQLWSASTMRRGQRGLRGLPTSKVETAGGRARRACMDVWTEACHSCRRWRSED